MIERKVVEEKLKEKKELFKLDTAAFFEKVSDLRKAILKALPENPDEMITIEELGMALKPTKVVCETRPKGVEILVIKFSTTEKSSCGTGCADCQKTDSCNGNCKCSESPQLCDDCFKFLIKVLNIMVAVEIVDIFPYEGTYVIGRHKE